MHQRQHFFRTTAIISVAAIISFGVFIFAINRLNPAPAANRQLLSMVMEGIEVVHYSPQPMDDAFSGKIFNEFIKRTDYNKKIFTQQDIDSLSQYKTLIDDELKDSSYRFFDAVMDRYYQRIPLAKRYSREALDKPVDLNSNESVETDEEKLAFATDTSALKESWRKYMTLQVLQQMNDDDQAQQTAHAKSDTVKLKSLAALEVTARQKVQKNNEDYWKRIDELEANDWVASYLNCISNIEDPHTEYFAPVEKQNFDIQMSGQLQGIGAQLQQKDGEIKVVSIVAGSASWKQGQLKAGDVIQKVAQGDQEPVSVVGMRLDKAIQLIRGKKGTEVRLTVRKADGAVAVIPIIRDIVILEATFAQSAVINAGGKKIGYIRLPEFYSPLDRQGGHSCAEDMKKEVLKLKAENVSGIIIDLRDNGGGVLREAVRMGGLFINRGPMVQVRPRLGNPEVLSDNDAGTIYDGPLTIMVNENSASASEILAAAMQDYHRAVIIGTDNTYGKGTVQNFYNLDNFANHSPNAPSFGSIKITIQKFYRINGGSTQLRGVTPDIILPDAYSEIPNGEKEDPYAIGWDEIPPANYQLWNVQEPLNELKSNSAARISKSETFNLIKQQADDYKGRSEHTRYSLNYKIFSAYQAHLDSEENRYDAITADTNLVDVSNLAEDLARINADSAAIARNAQFLKNLRRDVYLNEATKVTAEMK